MARTKRNREPRHYTITNVYMEGTEEERAERIKKKQQEVINILMMRELYGVKKDDTNKAIDKA